ncbi:MAG: DUF4268 domain-containing protein [Flavisolibacter sp.]
MYSRHEATRLKKEFWTVFGQYMAPIVSADHEKINWINYRTGEKDVYFKMQADHQSAVIRIELTHKDPGVRQIYFDQFQQFRTLLEETTGEEWTWKENFSDENGVTSTRIYKEVKNLNILKKEDWPALISFFKPRLIALDEFWSQVRYGFETLR